MRMRAPTSKWRPRQPLRKKQQPVSSEKRGLEWGKKRGKEPTRQQLPCRKSREKTPRFDKLLLIYLYCSNGTYSSQTEDESLQDQPEQGLSDGPADMEPLIWGMGMDRLILGRHRGPGDRGPSYGAQRECSTDCGR